MTSVSLLHELILQHELGLRGDSRAITLGRDHHTYKELSANIRCFASLLRDLGLNRFDRVAVYLPKQLETVASFFGASLADCVEPPACAQSSGEFVHRALRSERTPEQVPCHKPLCHSPNRQLGACAWLFRRQVDTPTSRWLGNPILEPVDTRSWLHRP